MPVSHACEPSYWEAEMGKILVWGHPRQVVLETPLSKITRENWTAGMNEVTEYKALSSKPQYHQKKKREFMLYLNDYCHQYYFTKENHLILND
jgi:hypothetical protein